jgi:hypothetical protein
MADLTAVPMRLVFNRRGGPILKLHAKAKNVEFQDSRTNAQTAKNPVTPESGTDAATITLPLECASRFTDQPKHGGVRNRADRVSEALTAAQVANLQAAVTHAGLIGLPFTRMITVHWERAGLPFAGMARATYRYLDYLGKALARHGAATTWVWVHENGPNKGGHAHILAHVPADLVPKIAKLQRGWLRRITGTPYRAKVILSRPIGGHLGVEVTSPDLHAVNLAEALDYVLKGADAEAHHQLGLQRQEPGGRVIGKRCGVS